MLQEHGEKRFGCDFDGVITHPEKFADAYLNQYIPRFCQHFSINQEFARWYFQQEQEFMVQNPEQYHFRVNNIRVLTGPGDPIIMTRLAAEQALRYWKHKEKRAVHIEESRWGTSLTDIYVDAYRNTECILNNGASKFLQTVQKLLPKNFFIISGSDAMDIRRGLLANINSSILHVNDLPIYGKAGKSHVVFTADIPVPKYVRMTGYPHHVPIRKPTYYNFLKDASNDFSAHLILASDIGEVDLALGAYLGMSTILVSHYLTSSWDKDHHSENKDDQTNTRAHVTNLDELLEVVTRQIQQ